MSIINNTNKFDFEALIDDINDKEDESTISQWLKNQNFDRNDEFSKIREVITPSSYNKQKVKSRQNSNYSQIQNVEEIKSDDDDDDKPAWSGLPRQVTFVQKEEGDDDDDFHNNDDIKDNPQNDIPSTGFDFSTIDSENLNVEDLLITLNSHLDFGGNPSVVQEMINRLQVNFFYNIILAHYILYRITQNKMMIYSNITHK